MGQKNSINFVHLCDMAFLSNTGKLNIIGVFENINVRKLPARYPRMALVMNAKLSKGSHKLKIRIVKEGGEDEIAKIEGNLEAKKDGSAGLINEFMDIVFKEAGKYEVEIWIDDDPADKIEFSVNEIKK